MKKRVNINMLRLLALAAASAVLLASCSNEAAVSDQPSAGTSSEQQTAVTAGPDTDNSSDAASGEATSDDMISGRDLDPSYDESSATVIELADESVTITQEGTYIIRGDLEDGQIVVDASSADKIQLVLDGCSVTSSTSAAIYVVNADKVFITLAEGSVNRLENGGTFQAEDDNNVDGVIFCKDDLTINGSGTLMIVSPAGHGIVCKDEMVITGGTFDIVCSEDAFQANDGMAVSDGVFTIDAGDDAIHCEGALVIDGGTVDVVSCTEGLEGMTVTINGGEINITSTDDGINASDPESSYGDMQADPNVSITINGGSVKVVSYGDGIDSNGDLLITGGMVLVWGPTNGGNGSLDYNGTGSVTGGTVVAAGATGMQMNFSDADQGSILLTTGQQEAGSVITVTDGNGEVVLSYASELPFGGVLISSAELTAGQTYTVSAGSFSEEVELTGNLYGESSGMFPGGGFAGGPGGFGNEGGAAGGPGEGYPGAPGEMPEGMTPPDGMEFPEGMTPPEGQR